MIYIKIMERVIVSIRHSSQFQYSFSPADRWTVREVDSSVRRYALGMSNGIF